MFRNRNRLTLQFHITGRCNLRCRHCYRTEGDIEALTYENIIDVIDQFIELRGKYNEARGIKKRGHINLTGGEPFFRKDIKEIIGYISDRRDQISFGILSNGSFIDGDMIKLLKESEVSFVQLSIDGDREMHDYLRAEGDCERVFGVAEELEKSGIRTHISFTANKENYKYFKAVADECRKRNISKLWSDRLVPIGNGESLESLRITENEMPLYIKALKKAQGSFFTKKLFPKTQVTMNRALQFLDSDGAIYSCSAGDSLITVDEFGRVMPCRRLPIICGNIFESSLEDIYYKNEAFIDLRRDYVPEECNLCKYGFLCRGGAKCQSYALYGDCNRADPSCFLAKR